MKAEQGQPQVEAPSQRRYNAGLLKRVLREASRLQNEHHGTLSGAEIETIGREVGLEPEFVRQAVERLESEGERAKPEAPDLMDYYASIMALTLPLLWGLVAAATAGDPGMRALMTWIGLAPVCVLLGFLSGSKAVAALSGFLMACVLAPTIAQQDPRLSLGWRTPSTLWPFWFPLTMGLEVAGAWLRQRCFPVLPTVKRVAAFRQVREELRAGRHIQDAQAAVDSSEAASDEAVPPADEAAARREAARRRMMTR